MPSEEVCNASPATVTLKPRQRDSGHLAVSNTSGILGHSAGIKSRQDETRLWTNHGRQGACVPALKPCRSWEGLRRKGQGFKPDLGNPAVRDYRGASGNVAMVEL